MFDVWNYATENYYDGAYNYPARIKLSDEDTAEIASIRTDLNTYFTENYVMFVDGSKSFAEWDSFQADINNLGYARIQEIYQQYYDEFIGA
jgi:putative aldouronate transport system substrate-binding protein